MAAFHQSEGNNGIDEDPLGLSDSVRHANCVRVVRTYAELSRLLKKALND
jgi:hypothetical protein